MQNFSFNKIYCFKLQETLYIVVSHKEHLLKTGFVVSIFCSYIQSTNIYDNLMKVIKGRVKLSLILRMSLHFQKDLNNILRNRSLDKITIVFCA